MVPHLFLLLMSVDAVARGNRRGADAPPVCLCCGDLDVADNSVNLVGVDALQQTFLLSVCFKFVVSIDSFVIPLLSDKVSFIGALLCPR